MAALVFVSYASPDLEPAERVRDDLEADGIPCWMAPRDVPAGGDYAEAITSAIEGCRAVLLLLSPAANASDHIEREAHLAVSQKRPILPVRLEDVKPDGALGYLLANAQWVDAFPRVEPSLGRVRTEVRRLLQRSGAPVRVSVARTPFQRVLASAVAWVTVFGLMLLLLTWMQRLWFNLVPTSSVALVAARQAPFVLVVLALVPLAALATQYWYHRSLSRVASLDVLFGIGAGTGVRVRSAVVAGLAGVLALAIGLAPPTVSIDLEGTPIDQYNADLTRVLSVPADKYVKQRGHYAVRIRVGSRNPSGHYTLRLELSPYATRDGVEFGDLLVDNRFGIAQVEPVPDDQRKVGHVDLSGPLDVFVGERTVRLTATHYRDARPAAPTIAAFVVLADRSRVDAKPQSIPAAEFPAE